MAEAAHLRLLLRQAQNPDGGWAYSPGAPSWTEPTALALLALESFDSHPAFNAALTAAAAPASAAARGYQWLARTQRADGGWAPAPHVEMSTWVTSLAVLALTGHSDHSHACARGVSWLLDHRSPPATPLQLFIRRISRLPIEPDAAGGLAWTPGTAPWITPTASAVLAIAQPVLHPSPALRTAIHQAQQCILARRCRDGGWNHGGSKYRSESSVSYPETTGIALAALHGVPAPELASAIARAQAFLNNPGSLEGWAWLQIGLAAHGYASPGAITALPCRNHMDLALKLLALTTESAGNKLILRPRISSPV